MRKLNKTRIKSSPQALVMFNDVLDAEKVLQSPEIEKIVRFFYSKLKMEGHSESPYVMHMRNHSLRLPGPPSVSSSLPQDF